MPSVRHHGRIIEAEGEEIAGNRVTEKRLKCGKSFIKSCECRSCVTLKNTDRGQDWHRICLD